MLSKKKWLCLVVLMVQGLRNSWVITVGIRETVHMHEVLLDTLAQSPNLTANVSIYVIVIMFMCIANVLALIFSVKNGWSPDL